jgi:glycosyltransferase involved in cell wall biosynthesis
LPSLPSVTIVVPTLDRAGLLERAVESVLAQDHPRLELLVLDDGSTDATPEVLARYAAEHPGRLRWERHPNMGQARTLNRGFEMARGELVGYLSSDDLLLPGALARLAGALAAEADAVLAYPAYHVIDAAGATVDTVTPIAYSRRESVRLGDTIVGPGALFRRAALDEVGGWDPDLRYLGDLDFWLRLCRVGEFRLVEEPLACWRRHEAAATLAGDGIEMARERIAVVERIYADDVPPELAEVRVEAYRNALILAAVVAGPGLNSPVERYHVFDSHARVISEAAGAAGPEAELDELRARVATQRSTIAELRRVNAELRATLAERRPLLSRAAGLTPRALRPYARRLFARRPDSAL